MSAATGQELQGDLTLARRWILLAVSCLILAGLLASSLVVARTPGLDRLVGDPLLFKRALVVHVDLSIVVWFYAFLAGLFALVPSTAQRSPLARLSPGVAAIGVALLVGAALVPHAQPVLSNYVPVIDHPLYAAGLIVFGAGVLFALFDPRLWPGHEPEHGAVRIPEATRVGLRAAALCVIAAAVTFFAASLGVPHTLTPEAFYEVLFWGGGHVLQFASEVAMLAVWCWLLTPVLGQAPLTRTQATWVFGLLLLPALAGPVLALQDPSAGAYRLSFMRLMQFGMLPGLGLAWVLIGRALLQAHAAGALHRSRRDPRWWAFLVSAALCVTGVALGALIRGSTTLVPAHYHAAIGAVTASFMAVTYLLLEPLGMPLPSTRLRRLAAVQPLLFGLGQFVFALGFGFAGAHGMGRKAYGVEQAGRTLPETVGLLVMGAGGLLAVAGGLSFLWIVGAAWRRSLQHAAPELETEGSTPWTLKPRSTPSRS